MNRSKLIATVLAGALALPMAAAAQDAAKGEKVFKKCKACHQVGEGAKNKTGPMLNGIVGRAAGTVEGFKYSKVMADAGEEGLVWTVEELDAYLTKPKEYMPGNKMSFVGLKREKDRANVIAYIDSVE